MLGTGITADYAESNEASYEHHPVDDIEPVTEGTDFKMLADALTPILVWITTDFAEEKRRGRPANPYNLRLIAFLFCLRPDMVGTSLRKVAKRCRCSQVALYYHVSEFRRLFGFRTSGQR